MSVQEPLALVAEKLEELRIVLERVEVLVDEIRVAILKDKPPKPPK